MDAADPLDDDALPLVVVGHVFPLFLDVSCVRLIVMALVCGLLS